MKSGVDVFVSVSVNITRALFHVFVDLLVDVLDQSKLYSTISGYYIVGQSITAKLFNNPSLYMLVVYAIVGELDFVLLS